MAYDYDYKEHGEYQHMVIVLALWLITFLQCGILKGMGLLLPILPEQFGSNTSTIGIVVSFLKLSGNIMGILVQPLTRLIEVRSIIIICGVLTTFGLIVSSVASDIPVFFLGMFLAGFTCVGDMLALALISLYFNKHYNAATNIITTALPLAVMTFAPLTQLFIDLFGWRGTLLLLAGIHFHYVGAAALLRPQNDRVSSDDQNMMKEPSDYRDEKSSAMKACHTDSANKSRWSDIFHDIFDASLLCNVPFVILLVIRLMSGYINNGWIVYLVSIAQNKGLAPFHAAFVPFFCGIGILVIRTTLAFAPNALPTRQLLYLGSVFEVVSFLGLNFATSFRTMSLLSVILGLGDGIMGSQIFTAVNSIVEKTKIVSAVAYIQLVHGIGFIVGGYVTGGLFELVDDFHLSLAVLCAVSSMSIITLGAEDTWNMLRRLHQDTKPVQL